MISGKIVDSQSSTTTIEAMKYRPVDRSEGMFRTPKRTAKFSTTAQILQIQQIVVRVAIKFSD